MKTLATLAFSLASLAALTGIASAAPTRDLPDPLPRPIPIPAPAPCTPAASAEKVFAHDVAGKGGVTIGFSAKPYLKADCDKLAAGVPLAMYGRLGPLSVDAFSVRLEASTNKAKKNKVDIGFFALNKKIAEYKIAETTAPIRYSELHELTVLAPYDRDWDHSYGFRKWGIDFEFTARLGVNAVAAGGAHIQAEVDTSGVELRLLAASRADASARASANVDLGHGIKVEFNKNFDLKLFWASVGARGLLQPKDGRWEADAGYFLNLDRLLGGQLTIDIPLYGDYDIFKRDWTWHQDQWEFNKLFDKQY